MDKSKSSRMRWSFLLLALAGAYFLFGYVLHANPEPLQAERAAAESCIRPQLRVLSEERGHHGKRWRVKASVRNNGGCDAWLFAVEFFPSWTYAGSWRGAWGIPAGGHLSNGFTISARDEVEKTDRAFSGVTGARVKSVIMTTNSGQHYTISPRLPDKRLRRHFVWLRNMRYFIRYYPAGQSAKTVRLLDSNGKLISLIRAQEGEFDDSL